MANAYGVLNINGTDDIIEDKLRKADSSLISDLNNNLRLADGGTVQIFFTVGDGGIPADPVVSSGAIDDSFFYSGNQRVFESRNERVFKS